MRNCVLIFLVVFPSLSVGLLVQKATTKAPHLTTVQRVGVLEQEVTKLQAQLHTVSNELTTVQNKLKTTTNQLTATTHQLNTVKQTLSHSSGGTGGTINVQELDTMKSQLNSLTTRFNRQQSRLNSSVLDALGADVKSNIHQIQQLKTKIDPTIDFQVSQSKKKNFNITLKFDTVEYNVGNGYNKNTGMFTAPVSGVYLFWAHVTFEWSAMTYVYIMLRQKVLAEAEIETSLGMSGSTEIAVFLQKGFHVHFTTNIPVVSTNAVIGNHVSYYGGVLVKATS